MMAKGGPDPAGGNRRDAGWAYRVSSLNFVLTLFTLALVAAIAFRFFPRVDALAAHQDGLATLNDLIRTAGFILLGVLAVFRFSAHRSFSPRGEVQLAVAAFKAPSGVNVHRVTVTLENKGSMSINGPFVAHVQADVYDKYLQAVSRSLVDLKAPDSETKKKRRSLVSPVESVNAGEADSRSGLIPFGNDAWLIDYQVIVQTRSRTWSVSTACLAAPSTTDK